MKRKNLQKTTAMAVLTVLLLGAVGLTKGYAYNVTIGEISNGTVVANPTTANEGDIVTLTATPGVDIGSGYFLQSWSVLDGDNISIAVTQGDNPNIGTFIMPSSDVTVTATFSRTYLLYLLFEDIQTCEDLILDGGGRGDFLSCQQLPWGEALWDLDWYWRTNSLRNEGYLWLAQNEKEGFQVFYGELEKERNLRIEVSPFLNTQNEVLQHSVYYEDFFYAEGMEVSNSYVGGSALDSLAEALIPYADELKRTSIGHNKAFFIELKSTKNQTPGEYISTITVYDGNDVLATRTIYATVWNFALPEGHYSEVVMGLYNRNSGYGPTSSLFKLNGINVDDDGNVVDENDLPLAKQILDGYHECLLEHGVSTYEIPRWKMDDDPKAAELIMADPRRKVFEVPVHWYDLSGSSFNTAAQSVINQYKDIVYDNVFLKDKAFFCPMDEPKWNIEGIVARFNTVCNALSESWPNYHANISFNRNYSQTAEMFEGKIDILCPNQALLDAYTDGIGWDIAQTNYEDFKDRNNHPDRFRTWRYQGDAKCGGTYFWISPLQTPGVMRRIPFWQQYLLNSDGWLHWNCAYLPDNWTKKKLPGGHGAATNNGDGILLYPGTMFGQSAETPIVSLRLKQLSAGIDDYDYLRLAKEFLNDEDIHSILSIIYRGEFETNCYMLTTRRPYLYDGWTCQHLQKARYKLGQLLSANNTEHTWGEWQTAVLPDENHDGLEIRTCSHCGTQESRPKTYSSLYRFVGTTDNQWANLANWANNPETLPASGEAAVIAHDCEIDTDITVFHVVVNDGCTLTIKDGATLTSEWVSTEGNAQVIIEDGAQLYTMSEGVQATVKKNIAAHSESGGWHFISSSVATDVAPSTDNGLVSSTQTNYDLYYYDEPAHYWRNYKDSDNSQDSGFDIEPLKGYLYANASDVTLSFAGTLQSGVAATSGALSYEAQSLTGWNLVGNPFPCNVYVDKSYYVLDEDGTAIYPTPVSIGTAIAPCTGIMVKAEGPDETVTFSKTAPETQGQNNGMLQIALSQMVFDRAGVSTGSTTLDKAIVSFNKGDQLGKFVFNKDNSKLYIQQDEEDYAIAYAEKQGEMPLNFVAKENGQYTISVNPENVEMNYLHLIDNLTGANIDLLAMPIYTFNANTNDYESRFKLVFASNNEDGFSTDSATFAFMSNGNWIINNVGEATLQIIDLTGRVLSSETINGSVSKAIHAMPGVYMIRLINGENVKVQKIVIE